MKKLEYTVGFATPAFLGNAEQQAQWRTPPFKALIRQWWRVVHSARGIVDVDRMRRVEGELFGAAADGDSTRSRVRIRLKEWSPGAVTQWGADDRVQHPEVHNRDGRQMPVGAQLYLGYGPLGFRQGATALNTDPVRSAIAETQPNALTLMFPDEDALTLQSVMQLIAWFGTLGSRSRNAWGSLQLAGPDLAPLSRTDLESMSVCRPLEDCLKHDWPHAIGADAIGPLVWKTKPASSWREVMKELARIKIAFRTQQTLTLEGVQKGQFGNRHFLAYPVTNHSVDGKAWAGQGRLGNQLRFKLLREEAGLAGVMVHLPARLPEEMVRDLPRDVQQNLADRQLRTWRAVHDVLNAEAIRIA